MDITAMMSAQDRVVVNAQVDAFNKSIGVLRDPATLDKNDFLKILMTQLTHQDPTEPMKDRDFIAQMAQFSTLEQITNMSQDFNRLAAILSAGRALDLLGRNVEIVDGGMTVEGRVEEIVGHLSPRVLVGGRYYDVDKVERVKE